LKITIVQGAFLPIPALLGGAVEKVWAALGREFAARNHQVTHLSRQHPNLPTEETTDGVRHIRIPGFDTPASLIRLKLLDLIFTVRVLRKLPPADILVTNTFWLPLLARDRSRGHVYVHVARYPKGQIRFYTRAARLQTVSHAVAEAIVIGAPKLTDRVRVIPYPMIEDCPAPINISANTLREKTVLYVGRVHPEKGVHLLIEAFTAIAPQSRADWRLVIVGPSEVRLGGGGDEYAHLLRTLAAPIADQVDWIGPVFDTVELDQIYRRATIFTYPSLAERGETFGLAPLEAMARGCVPVVSNLGCFRDFIEDQVDGIFFNHASDQPAKMLATELAELMRKDGQCAELSRGATRKAETYRMDRITTLFLNDFQSICGN
jgi:glycosyltransferase involved in cell wall biosynthesis